MQGNWKGISPFPSRKLKSCTAATEKVPILASVIRFLLTGQRPGPQTDFWTNAIHEDGPNSRIKQVKKYDILESQSKIQSTGKTHNF